MNMLRWIVCVGLLFIVDSMYARQQILGGVKVNIPDVPKNKILIQHGDPFPNYKLDKDTPKRLMVYVQDAHGWQVTWGSVLKKGQHIMLPVSETMKFKEPFTISVASIEYGQLKPPPFGPVYRGDAVAVWHKGAVETAQRNYRFYCMGSDKCASRAMASFDYDSDNIEELHVSNVQEEKSKKKPVDSRVEEETVSVQDQEWAEMDVEIQTEKEVEAVQAEALRE